ncbi:hypothetical protein CBOM_01081 [Ceraceosorus bombacis]|uniref:Uncharacterized protein n=1 Tax=Ceraceosorus bombacis TaxID=401625 RepID=A0A0P1BC99_9BASI|nr:hypothetical protein CBOM_01081 [Ceraceosorus bombacis]
MSPGTTQTDGHTNNSLKSAQSSKKRTDETIFSRKSMNLEPGKYGRGCAATKVRGIAARALKRSATACQELQERLDYLKQEEVVDGLDFNEARLQLAESLLELRLSRSLRRALLDKRNPDYKAFLE